MRTLYLTNPPLKGDDVKRVQRLLAKGNVWKRNFHPGKADGNYGEQTAKSVRDAKYFLGYPKKKISKQAGKRFVQYLTGTKRLPAYYRYLKKRRRRGGNIRDAIVREAMWGINHEPSIHYRQSRPIPLKQWKAHKLPLYTDCSGSITGIFYSVGAPDPNGLNYNGQGYTGTMLNHLKRIPRSQLRRGDLVVFGPGTGHHVCLVIKGGADPVLFSHGQERGPFKISLSDETRFQQGPVTYLSAGV